MTKENLEQFFIQMTTPVKISLSKLKFERNHIWIYLDSLKSGNITGQYQMSPEISRKIGTFDNDRGTNDIAQGHLIVTSQYQLSQRDVLRTFDID